jgi:hypothetical protein
MWQIAQVSLPEATECIAISYVWGDPSATHKIRIGGNTIGITASLHFASKQVRQEEHPVVVWADAICINQNDNREKAVQIEIMKDIYAQAEYVAAISGDAADDSHLVPGLITAIVESGFAADPHKIRVRDFAALSIPDVDDPAWAAGRAFFRRPWWRRVWIAQEFVVARGVQITCVDWSMSWEHIASVIHKTKQFKLYDVHIDPEAAELDVINSSFNTACALVWTRSTYMFGKRSSLLGFLQLFGSFQATRARDHLFALLGLANDGCASELDPDYDQSLVTILIRYATYFIRRDQSIALLYYVGANELSTRFPSWLPDWTRLQRRLVAEDLSTKEPLYHAGGTGTPQIQFTNENRTLTLKGDFIDAILDVGEDHKLARTREAEVAQCGH